MNNANFQQLPIWNIHRDPMNQRALNRANVDSIKQGLLRGMNLDPIRVRESDGLYLCTDGMHRLIAYRELGATSLYVIVDNTNDLYARQTSFWANEGMNNSDGDRAQFFLQQYQMGISVKHMKTQRITESKVRQYIIWGYWLDQIIFDKGNDIITIEGKNTLTKYEKPFQIAVLNYFISQRSHSQKLGSDIIQNLAVQSGIEATTRYMKQIPRDITKSIQVHEQIMQDPIIESLDAIHQQIVNISKQTGRTIESLYGQLHTRHNIFISQPGGYIC